MHRGIHYLGTLLLATAFVSPLAVAKPAVAIQDHDLGTDDRRRPTAHGRPMARRGRLA